MWVFRRPAIFDEVQDELVVVEECSGQCLLLGEYPSEGDDSVVSESGVFRHGVIGGLGEQVH